MGKLAERLSDPARSGIYRVEGTDAVEEAACLNHYPLVRIMLDGDPSPVVAAADVPGNRVILVSEFERFFREQPAELHTLVAALGATAHARREHGERFFVAFVDPRRALPGLARLYNWDRSDAGRSRGATTEVEPGA